MASATASPSDIPAAADVRGSRRSASEMATAFADSTPPLTRQQALAETERCLYCFDAPCTRACPTGIDVPSFIRRIADDNLRGAARTILEANPLAGTCARACPTEVLCEEVCVRHTGEGRPVAIGRLQRHAVDAAMQQPVTTLFERTAPSGRCVAVVGAGPAGLACAFMLARRGHAVVLHDARAAAGGLNEYGLAAYKMAGGFAQAELDWLLQIGGITLQLNWRLEGAAQVQALLAEFDAVYLALGLGRTRGLEIPGVELEGVVDAVDFIAGLRQAQSVAELTAIPVGRRVVVIGGGMTAVDAAVQSRLLGAEEVHMVYRGTPQAMGASAAEREWAQTQGVMLHFGLAPVAMLPDGGGRHVGAVQFSGRAGGTGTVFPADMVLKAIGQRLDESPLAGTGLRLQNGRVLADADGRTSVPRLFAGGDCRAGGRDLTVEAVEDGKRVAAAIAADLARA